MMPGPDDSGGNDEDSGEEAYEQPTEQILEELELVKKKLALLKPAMKVEYLEQWREDWLKRMNYVINWAVTEPGNYGDVVSMLYRFEEFFTQMMITIGEHENLKKSYGEYLKSKAKSQNVSGIEIG